MNTIFMNSLLMAGFVSSAAAPDSTTDVRAKLTFSETFDDEKAETFFQNGKWVLSKDEKYADQPVMVKGLNDASEAMKTNRGLELTQENKFYGVGAPFSFDFKPGKDFVAQYEFNAEKLECGGAYIKLPRVGDDVTFDSLNADSPYSIMFGPDKCGSNAKVHFIVQYKNPVTEAWEEKHLIEPPQPKMDRKTHLYTLHIKADSTFDIFIDKENVKSGSLLTDMEPPINPSEHIDDPTDFKPADWVDEAQISDPAAEKPADWDEDAPLMIDDLDEVMPSDWQVEAELMVPDPEASRPDDWEDEEDGEWEAPLVPNPVCKSSGCGIWTQPQKKNPAYQGPWSAPLIDNPLYKGEWKANQIKNPAYFSHANPVDHLAPIDGVFLEVWTTNNAFHFDNFVFGQSLEDAFAFATDTFDVKVKEEALYWDGKSKDLAEKSRTKKLNEGGMANLIEVYFADAADFIGKQDPITLAMSLVSLFAAIVYLVVNNSQASPVDLTNEARSEADAVTKEEADSTDQSADDDKKEEKLETETEAPVVEKEEAKKKKKPASPAKTSTSKRRTRRTGD